MPRKKVTNEADDAGISGEIDNLADGEEITIQDTRKIRKTTSRTADAQTKVVEIESDEDFEDEPDELPFAETSIAGSLLADEENHLQHTIANILVRRNIDSFGDTFLKPCKSQMSLPPMRNVDITSPTSKLDTEEQVRLMYGGGHYFFQVQLNGRLWKSWSETLSDTPEAIEQAAAAKQAATNQPAPPASPQPATNTGNPIDAWIADMRRQKEMKELLFGEEQKELERLRAEANRQSKTDTGQTDLGLVLSHADSKHFDKLLDRVLPAENSSIVKEVVDGVKEVLPYGAEIGGFIRSFIGGWAGTAEPANEQTNPPTEADLLNMLKGDGASTTDAPPKSNFKRRKPAKKNNA